MSITMRKILRSGVCECAFPEGCDTAIAAARGEDPKLPPHYHRQKREDQQAAKQRKDETRAASAQNSDGGNGVASGGRAGPSADTEIAASAARGSDHSEPRARPEEPTPAVELEYVWGVYEVRLGICAPLLVPPAPRARTQIRCFFCLHHKWYARADNRDARYDAPAGDCTALFINAIRSVACGENVPSGPPTR